MASAEDRSAPEGAACRKHPERRALFTCPRCHQHACMICWQDVVDRCHACVVRDPTAGIDRLPWEDKTRPALARYLRTLGSALHPRKSAAAFAYEGLAGAVRFLLLTAVPMAALAGVVPHTRTLLFAGSFEVSVLGRPGVGEMAFDVVRAMFVEILLSGIALACLALPFVSLVKAYAPIDRSHAALRALLYRGWLLPFAWLVFYIGTWALPTPIEPVTAETAVPAGLRTFALIRDLIPILLLLAMVATARLACGLGPLISMVVVLVPAILMALVSPLATVGIVQFMLPPSPTVEQARPGAQAPPAPAESRTEPTSQPDSLREASL